MAERKRNKPVLSVGAYDIGTTDAWVQDDQRYPADILPDPEKDSTLERTVRLGRASQVNGFVYGKWITMAAGFSDDAEDVTSAVGLYAVELIELQNYCKIATHVQCNGEITIGSQCEIFGDVIANQTITIGDSTRIAGNVIAEGNIVVGSEVWIGGYVVSLNGSIAINDNSEIFDIIADGDIELGDKVTVIDRVVRSTNGKVNLPDSIKVGNNTLGVGTTTPQLVVRDLELSSISDNLINSNELEFEGISYSQEKERLLEALSTLEDSLE
jgi:acetyltransferase-like isoleucine patch superfamily enzyme